MGRFGTDAPASGDLGLGIALRNLNHYEDADAVLRDGLEKHESNIDLMIEFARVAMSTRDFEGALTRWTEALVLNCDAAKARKIYLGLSQVYRSLRRYPEAEATLLQYMKDDGHDIDFMLEFAWLAIDQDNFPEAEKRLHAVQEFHPEDWSVGACRALGNAYKRIGLHDRAHDILRKNFQRVPTCGITDAVARSRVRVLNVLNYTKISGSAYAAESSPAGYQTVEIGGEIFEGRRNPAQRLRLVPYDFAGKSVLDIGSNQGGMLIEIAHAIKAGVGIDYDSRMINAANLLRSLKKIHNIDFYVFDLERDDLELVTDFFSEPQVDIVFLLSICRWVKNWREIIDFSARISGRLLFESNGSREEQDRQIDYINCKYNECLLLKETSCDDARRADRKLYLCNTHG